MSTNRTVSSAEVRRSQTSCSKNKSGKLWCVRIFFILMWRKLTDLSVAIISVWHTVARPSTYLSLSQKKAQAHMWCSVNMWPVSGKVLRSLRSKIDYQRSGKFFFIPRSKLLHRWGHWLALMQQVFGFQRKPSVQILWGYRWNHLHINFDLSYSAFVGRKSIVSIRKYSQTFSAFEDFWSVLCRLQNNECCRKSSIFRAL